MSTIIVANEFKEQQLKDIVKKMFININLKVMVLKLEVDQKYKDENIVNIETRKLQN